MEFHHRRPLIKLCSRLIARRCDDFDKKQDDHPMLTVLITERLGVMRKLCGRARKVIESPDHPLDRRTPKSSDVMWGWILLGFAAVIYFLEWGLGTVRAAKCLIDGHPPRGHWYDFWSSFSWHVPLVIAGSSTILCLALRYVGNVECTSLSEYFNCVVKRIRDVKTWVRDAAVLGLVWSIPLFITRVVKCIFPSLFAESSCHYSPDKNLVPWDHLGGPVEELWFAAALAAIVILTRGKPRVRLLCAVLGGALLRGVFHVYQGWESAGLFVWGAIVAVAIAWTGRWVLFFILHFINNFLISKYRIVDWGVPLLFTAFSVVCLIILYTIIQSRSACDVKN